MKKTIESILKEMGPILSGELAQIYSTENNTSNENARQAISRARSPIQKNKLIPFQNNQIFVYLESQYMNQNYWSSLSEAIRVSSKKIYQLVTSLVSQSGFISKEKLASYSIAPITNLKKHKRFDVLIEQLKHSQIIMDSGDYFQLNENLLFKTQKANLARAKAIEIAKKMVLIDFNDMMRKTNIIAYNKGAYWSEFAHMQWGFTAPSYLQGIANMNSNNIKPGFLLADILLKKNASIDDVSFFIGKINIINSFKNIYNFIPSLIVYNVDSNAHELLKKSNIAILQIETLFGDKYAELLDDLINVVTNATAFVLKNPGKIDEIFNALTKHDGRYNNIVGDMFELMVAEFYRTLGVNYIEVNKQVHANETLSGYPKEIDILVEKNGTIIIIECKATNSTINLEFVERWISTNIPDINNFLKRETRYSNKKIEHQIWSVGGFSTEAEEKLLAVQESVKKYKINFLNKEDMLEFGKKNNEQTFISRIKKHFC